MPDALTPVIRSVEPSDAAAVAAVYAHHVAYGTASFDTVARSVADTLAKIIECADHRWPFLVAEVDRAVVGYAYATQFRDRPAYASTCENSIYIGPDYVGRGVGTKLLATLIDAAEMSGFRQMIAVIGGAEPASVALHAKAGFVETGRMRSVGWKLNKWLDSLYMQRSLGVGDQEAAERQA